MLAGLFPDQREPLEKAYAASLAKLSGERGVEPGAALGEQAGKDCLAMRGKDGVGAANVYRPVTSPGRLHPDRPDGEP